MIVELIRELTVIGVHDRGIPNQERIVIAANETVNLGQYGLMVGLKGSTGTAYPIKDNLLWFGDAEIKEGDWLFVYTGHGKAKVSTLPNNSSRIISIHWGRDWTIFLSPEVVPILFRVDAVHVPSTQSALPGSST